MTAYERYGWMRNENAWLDREICNAKRFIFRNIVLFNSSAIFQIDTDWTDNMQSHIIVSHFLLVFFIIFYWSNKSMWTIALTRFHENCCQSLMNRFFCHLRLYHHHTCDKNGRQIAAKKSPKWNWKIPFKWQSWLMECTVECVNEWNFCASNDCWISFTVVAFAQFVAQIKFVIWYFLLRRFCRRVSTNACICHIAWEQKHHVCALGCMNMTFALCFCMLGLLLERSRLMKRYAMG